MQLEDEIFLELQEIDLSRFIGHKNIIIEREDRSILQTNKVTTTKKYTFSALKMKLIYQLLYNKLKIS